MFIPFTDQNTGQLTYVSTASILRLIELPGGATTIDLNGIHIRVNDNIHDVAERLNAATNPDPPWTAAQTEGP